MSGSRMDGAALIAALETVSAQWPTDGPGAQVRALVEGSGTYTLGQVLALNLDREIKTILTNDMLKQGITLWDGLNAMPASPLGDPDMLPDGW